MTKPSLKYLPDDTYIWHVLSEIGPSPVKDWKDACGLSVPFQTALMRLRASGCVKYDAEQKTFSKVREPASADYEEKDETPEGPKWLKFARKFMKQIYPRGSRRLISYRGSFYRWDGSHYAAVDDDTINSEIYMWLEKPALKPRYEVRSALQAMTHINRDLQAPAWLDGDHPQPATDYVSCKNGLLSIPTGEVLPHSSNFLTMNALPCDFDPDAKAPRWEQFLDEAFGTDTAAIELLQEMFGYILSRSLDQQKLFMIVGPKRSGKGTLARILMALCGKGNVAGPTIEDLKNGKAMEGLIDKILAIIPDARLEGFGNHALVERLLAISGADTQHIWRKYKSPWDGVLGVRVLILCNDLPAFTDASGVIASRFMVLRTQQSFFGREDTKLTEKLLGELPGILNWAIAGFRRLRARGYFVQPASSQADIDELEEQASPCIAFVKDHCLTGAAYTTDAKILLDAYNAWREDEHYKDKTTGRSFGRQLRTAAPNVNRVRVGSRGDQRYVYQGIRLISTTRAMTRDEEWEEAMREQEQEETVVGFAPRKGAAVREHPEVVAAVVAETKP
jgi:putative DNA primase/helicase